MGCLEELVERGLVRRRRFSEPVRSVAEASRVAGVEAGGIVKTLVWVVDGRFVAVIVRGDCRVNVERLRRELGAVEARPASREEVSRATGYPVGGVPPVCLEGVDLVVVDRGVLVNDVVVGGGGDERSLVWVRVSTLLDLVRPLLAEVADCG